MCAQKRTVGEIEGFINMLRAACEDITMHETLEKILSQPDQKRKTVIFMLIKDLKEKNAPAELIEAISCLVDNKIAEKAYEVIHKCST